VALLGDRHPRVVERAREAGAAMRGRAHQAAEEREGRIAVALVLGEPAPDRRGERREVGEEGHARRGDRRAGGVVAYDEVDGGGVVEVDHAAVRVVAVQVGDGSAQTTKRNR
jgi:hypothetical protein